jgi:hypothetical protein
MVLAQRKVPVSYTVPRLRPINLLGKNLLRIVNLLA